MDENAETKMDENADDLVAILREILERPERASPCDEGCNWSNIPCCTRSAARILLARLDAEGVEAELAAEATS